ncbi:hypothetical protein B484DRAFT_453551 [Ochromonadaceae sp. CCMP2298]|nr:hypothetical protein B484DRAFT_453551 [Ochromonadaceae sp. CCMP2298]
MPGRNDTSSGFTKSANKTKFIRKRDVKQKDGEVKKEQVIYRLMCEGVCNRCRDKAQWRFKYDKYKPLTKPGTCQQCKRRVITKAYRCFCDGCASAKKVCPACSKDMAEANREHAAIVAKAAKTGKVDEGEMEEGEDEVEMGEDVDEGEEDGEDAEGMDVPAGADDGEEEGGDSDGEAEAGGDMGATMETSGTRGFNAAIEGLDASAVRVTEVLWNERKFSNMAANKYKKDRTTGSEGGV